MIPLPASLDLVAAEGLCSSIAAGLSEGGVALDGSAVERIATPCLQVLAAAAATARARELPFRLVQPSAALQAAIADLGLQHAIPFED